MVTPSSNKLKPISKYFLRGMMDSSFRKMRCNPGEPVKTYKLDYHGGERFPHLERDASKPDLLDQIIKGLGHEALIQSSLRPADELTAAAEAATGRLDR